MMKIMLIILSVLSYTVGFSQSSSAILKKYYSNARQPGGILVLKNTAEIKTSYTGLAHLDKNIPISAETRFRMASVSKQFTAMAVYLLIQEGKITFETPIHSVLPELSKSCSSIKIKHLLNHSSGLLDYENVIPDAQKEQLTDYSIVQLIQNLDTVYFEAGTNFRYSNTAYCLMSLIVERISNQSYEEFCKERIFQKLNMSSAQISAPRTFENRAFGYHPKNSDFQFADQSITSATRGDGGVYISANDYAKWMDKRNPFYTSQFFEDLEKYKIAVKDGVYYSLGLFFTKTTDGGLMLFHSGESTGFHHIFLFQPKQNLGVFLFTNRDDLIIADVFKEVLQKENIVIPTIKESLFIWLNKVYSNE